jgi:hypothetical protein
MILYLEIDLHQYVLVVKMGKQDLLVQLELQVIELLMYLKTVPLRQILLQALILSPQDDLMHQHHQMVLDECLKH